MQSRAYLQVYVNSFGDGSLEQLLSRRLRYLLQAKSHLIEIRIIDVNQEMASVLRQQTQTRNLRDFLLQKHRLVQNREFGEMSLPQVFLVQEPNRLPLAEKTCDD